MRDDTLNAAAEVDSRPRQFLGHHGFMRERPPATADIPRARPEAGFLSWPAFFQASASGRCCSRQLSWRGSEFLIDELADRIAEHPQFVIHPR